MTVPRFRGAVPRAMRDTPGSESQHPFRGDSGTPVRLAGFRHAEACTTNVLSPAHVCPHNCPCYRKQQTPAASLRTMAAGVCCSSKFSGSVLRRMPVRCRARDSLAVSEAEACHLCCKLQPISAHLVQGLAGNLPVSERPFFHLTIRRDGDQALRIGRRQGTP